jgi:hypothetical protein
VSVEIFQISAEQFETMIADDPDAKTAMTAAKFSAELIVGMYNEVPAIYVGLAPRTLLSDDAYIWLIVTEVGAAHGRLLARYSREFIATALLKYSVLRGHCFSPSAAKWLRWLGAEFVGVYEFEIRRNN